MLIYAKILQLTEISRSLQSLIVKKSHIASWFNSWKISPTWKNRELTLVLISVNPTKNKDQNWLLQLLKTPVPL